MTGNDFSLSLNEFIARRESVRIISTSSSSVRALNNALQPVFRAVNDVFRKGRKLNDQQFDRFAGAIAAALSESGHIKVQHLGKIIRLESFVTHNIDHSECAVARTVITLSRKRLDCYAEPTYIGFSRHTLERAYERHALAGMTADQFYAEMYRAIPLLYIWRFAFLSEPAILKKVAAPTVNGMLLGVLSRSDDVVPQVVHTIVAKNGFTELLKYPVPTIYPIINKYLIAVNFKTTISDDQMSSDQLDLKDAINKFIESYKDDFLYMMDEHINFYGENIELYLELVNKLSSEFRRKLGPYISALV